MRITAYSKALFSNWFHLDGLRLLLDAGEGVAAGLEGRLLGVRQLLLTHAHTDHFTGLHTILSLRLRDLLGGLEIPPLCIAYPGESPSLRRYMEYLRESVPRFGELVTLQPVGPGERFPLEARKSTWVTVLEARHVDYEPCLAYRLTETRTRLKPEAQGLEQQEIRRLIQEEGREAITCVVEVPLVTYSGDGQPLQDPASRGVPLLIHEATFLGDETTRTHSTLGQALEKFRALEAEHLLLFHFSTRYHREEITTALSERLEPGEEERVHALMPGRTARLEIPVAGM